MNPSLQKNRSAHCCTGLIFRAYSSQYFDKKAVSFNYREGFRLLKRKSCKCKDCEKILRCLTEEDGSNLLDCSYWALTMNHGQIETDSEYRLVVTEWESDWDESGPSFDWIESIKMEKIER